MTLSLCWESHGQCQDHHIFKNARLPKAVCDWDMGYNIPGGIFINSIVEPV